MCHQNDIVGTAPIIVAVVAGTTCADVHFGEQHACWYIPTHVLKANDIAVREMYVGGHKIGCRKITSDKNVIPSLQFLEPR